MANRTVTNGVETEAEPDAVFAVLADPHLLPRWAPGFADSVVDHGEDRVRVTKDGTAFVVSVVAHPEARTVDLVREIAPGRVGGASMRAVPRLGGGSVIVVTLPVLPGVEPEAVAAILDDELAAIARLAESTSV